MKTLKLVAAIAVALTVCAGTRAHAATASADAKAQIVVAIQINKDADLNFAGIVAGVTEGTVVMAPNGDRSATGGVTLGPSAGKSAAAFTVTGANDATYAITLPSSAVVLDDGAAHTMTLDTFTSDPSGTGTLNGAGTQALHVGGTLHVGASQASGSYTQSFNVTVAYN